MQAKLSFYTPQTSSILPAAAAVLAATIFAIDAWSPLEMAVAVLHVIVIMLAANFCRRRGVIAVSIGCATLTVLAFLISHGLDYESMAFARCVVSLAAIAIATFLVLKNKSSEIALREQANLLDVTHDAIFVRDMQDIITYWNSAAEKLYGWKKEQALGRNSHQLMRTRFPIPLREITGEFQRSAKWEGELIHTRLDGSQVTVASRWSAQRGEQGQTIGIMETNNDVTERKQAEDALRRSESYLAEAQRLSNTGSFGWNVSRGGLFWSAETWRIFEYHPSTEPTFELVFQRTHPDDQALVRGIVERASLEAKDWSAEYRLLMPSGAIKHLKVVAHAVKDAAGNLEFVGALMDVTAAKQAEEEMQQTRNSLAHANRVTSLGEMTASIAHEVNQPIAAVVVNAGAGLRWLAAKPPNLMETEKALSRILKDGSRAGDVIARIRALSRRVPQRKDRFDINDAILEVVALARSEAASQRISVRPQLDRALPLVSGDRVQLQQVVLNLLINAIQAMAGEEAGTKALTISSRKSDAGDALVVVQDTGPGLPADGMDRVFDAFYTTKSDGMGLGLAICRSIVEAHDGRLWVTANDPKGCVFQFSLPCEP